MPSLLDIFSEWSMIGDKLSPFSKSSQKITYQTFKDSTKTIYGQEIGLGLARLNGLGSGYYEKKQYETARLYWLELIQDYPFFTPVYIDIAETYLAQTKPKDAISYLQKGLMSLQSNHFFPSQTQVELAKVIQQKLAGLR